MPIRDLYGTLFRRVLLPAYETVLRRRKTFAHLAEYTNSQWLSADAIADLQWRKTQALVRHCWDEVPFYREHWGSVGMDSADAIRCPTDFARLPILTKQHVRERFEDLKAASLRNRLYYKTTGGSTGEPLLIGYTRESYERRTAVMLRGYAWASAMPGHRADYLWGQPLRGLSLKERLHHAAFNRRILNVFGMSEDNLGEYADRIAARQPDVIVGYVAPLARLAQWALREGRHMPSPRTILCAAEPLHAYQRELIERAFGCPVHNTYGCREFMLIASQCEHRDGLHINADHLNVELGDTLDDANSAAPREVLVTDLHNYGMPLVRYANGDIATPGPERCDCGRGLPLLGTVDGRKMDVLRSSAGHFVGEYLEHLVFDAPGIRRFRAIQHRVGEIEVHLVRAPEFQESTLDALRERMRDAYGDGVRLQFRFVDDIPLTPAGKLRVAISTLATSATSAVAQWTDRLHESGVDALALHLV